MLLGATIELKIAGTLRVAGNLKPNFETISRDTKNDDVILERTTKNSFLQTGFELASSGFYTGAQPVELSSQLKLVAMVARHA